MSDKAGSPRVLEFNCRRGAPEPQPMLMRVKSDLFELIECAVETRLDAVEAVGDRRAALGVVLAGAGSPDVPRKGDPIEGLPAPAEDVRVFHAGTALVEGRPVTSGGRVLCVTALGDSIKMARARAHPVVAGTRFSGMQCRHDIGHRAMAMRAGHHGLATPKT